MYNIIYDCRLCLCIPPGKKFPLFLNNDKLNNSSKFNLAVQDVTTV